MGVPKFFRWLVDKFPAVLVDEVDNTLHVPEIDNLYLDMNGIIHNCSHSESGLTLNASFSDIFSKVAEEVDRLVCKIVKPRKVLYIAVDGVAPRAKLNQQRARRFRSAKERAELAASMIKEGSMAPSDKVFDSNCITPGTDFMAQLSVFLRAYVEKQMRNNELWSHLNVIFSGSEVPGEGEHKIIAYIRETRSRPDYSPNVKHCIHGADADMIMLSLSTHEPFFVILREVPVFQPKSSKANKSMHAMAPPVSVGASNFTAHKKRPKMCFVRINIVRELIAQELLEGLKQDAGDIERVLDDFVFLTFLVGNDFLPQLPAMNIGDDAFDVIFEAYKTVLTSGSGYLIADSVINFEVLQTVLALIAPSETLSYVESLRRQASRHQPRGGGGGGGREGRIKSDAGGGGGPGSKTRRGKAAAFDERMNGGAAAHAAHKSVVKTEKDDEEAGSFDEEEDDDAAASDSSNYASDSSRGSRSSQGHRGSKHLPATKAVTLTESDEAHRANYYRAKFGIEIHTDVGRAQIISLCRNYMEGLQWCLSYYSRGCVSWGWFYAYHYSPFMHELCDMFPVPLPAPLSFELQAPLAPFEQLLACLPPLSSQLVPAAYQPIFSAPTSPMLPFYPSTFEEDMNGKKMAYEAVIILPFIDMATLLETEKSFVSPEALSADENHRNSMGVVYSFLPTASLKIGDTATVSITEPQLSPMPHGFRPDLVKGTTLSTKGFPSLAQLPPADFFKKSMGGKKESYFKHGSRGKGKQNIYDDENQKGVITASPGDSRTVAADERAEKFRTHISKAHIQMRLLFDDITCVFLHELTGQIHSRFNSFHSQLKPADSRLSPDAIDGLFCVSSTAFLSQELAPELIENVMPKVLMIFGKCELNLLPLYYIDRESGILWLKFDDASHFRQIDQFITQKLHLPPNEMLFRSYFSVGAFTDHSQLDAFDHWLSTELRGVIAAAAGGKSLLTGAVLEVYRRSASSSSPLSSLPSAVHDKHSKIEKDSLLMRCELVQM
jgi:hypothetical protein